MGDGASGHGLFSRLRIRRRRVGDLPTELWAYSVDWMAKVLHSVGLDLIRLEICAGAHRKASILHMTPILPCTLPDRYETLRISG